ncbi:MAG: alpha-amylase [Bacteroidetes bacterium RBG_19FT_COMBO_42_10]|nr:MAG: alpha-amylase [Bacteroidetes bacterium RBG_19FT_COMBO_42_10]
MNAAGKKAICFYFQVHQPFRLKRYRFFDLGHDHYYYDDFSNESIMRKVAGKCYLPANKIIMDLIQKHKGKFKVAFSISGIVINQFRLYAPDVLESFRQLAETGMVEFLAETNAHSLASLKSKNQFEQQVNIHREMVKTYLGVETTSFRNTELIYSDQIGAWIADMGFKSMLTEGAKHVLGWKSPNYLYCNAINPRLKVLLRNFVLSDDIAFRFSNKSWSAWPLTADKYASWLNKLAPKSELVNIFLDYETFGEHNWKETGIFDFLRHLPGAVLKKTPFKFMTPSEIADTLQPVSAISVTSPISWADEERDITAWLGNELQVAAIDKLYELSEKVKECNDEQMNKDYEYLQSSDHFYYMATKFFSDGAVHAYFNPYETPYDAFMNYMNVLGDFEIRVNRCLPLTSEQFQISKLDSLLKEKEKIIEEQAAEIQKLKGEKTKAKPKRRIAVTTEPKTSLKELAQELLAESTRRGSGKKTSAATANKSTKSVKKSTSRKTTAKKPAVKKTAAKKTATKKTSSKRAVKKVKK